MITAGHRRLLATATVFLLAGPSLPARTWTDVDGRSVEADYVSHDGKELVMRLGNGREARVPLEKLSEKDREFLESEKGEPAEGSQPESDGELNWDAPWPETIELEGDVEIEVVEENEKTGSYVYTSDNYRFTCDARLSASVVSTFADMFEATRLFCRALPLGVSGGKMNDGKYDILLFEKKENYIKAGGPPSSAGVFISGRNVVMVPLISLGVRPVGSGYMRDRDKSDGTLIHEIVHQLTPGPYYLPGSMGWFTEGIAEYCKATPYGYGRFRARNNLDEIVAYATSYGKDGKGGRALGEEIGAPRLRDFMTMSYSEFAGGKANFNYGLGLLLTTYFFHLDGEGDAARMKEFLKAMRHRTRGDAPDKAFEKLLDGRSWQELEEDIAKEWRRKGVDIEFPEWE